MNNDATRPAPRETYLRYAPNRDVVFVMGAGASHPDGVPLQEHILPMMFSGEDEDISDSVIGIEVAEFLSDNFYIDTENDDYPKLEAVFGFIDYFMQQNESLSAKYTHAKIRRIRENLIKLIHTIVNLSTDNHSHTYHLFWDKIRQHNRNVSIITLNYDTLLEQAFDFLFRQCGYIDYCIHLMNYEKFPELAEFNYWINPREPICIGADESPVAFKLIKLHGSLNWKYCNCCNQTLLTPWDRKIDLNRGKLVGYSYPDQKEYDYYCPLDGTEFQTVIMPPSFLKALNHPVISQLFSEAAREIRLTRRVVFIGYSLSDADIHIKSLFKKHLRSEVEVVVVNIKHSADLTQHYRALTKNVTFIQTSFEAAVHDPKLMERLLT
jgi:NAD-dependent SIR2 family protein deacetylase